MVHDSQHNSCPDQGGVMAAIQGQGVEMYEWSNCSASELRAFRIAGGTKCLMETHPANSLVKPSSPGQEFNLTYQCKAMFGDHATVCPWRPTSVSSLCLHVNTVYARIHICMCTYAYSSRHQVVLDSIYVTHTLYGTDLHGRWR